MLADACARLVDTCVYTCSQAMWEATWAFTHTHTHRGLLNWCMVSLFRLRGSRKTEYPRREREGEQNCLNVLCVSIQCNCVWEKDTQKHTQTQIHLKMYYIQKITHTTYTHANAPLPTHTLTLTLQPRTHWDTVGDTITVTGEWYAFPGRDGGSGRER